MRHAFGIGPLSRGRCKGRMRFVNLVFDAREVKRLLAHPLLRPTPAARRPPEEPGAFDFF